MAERLKNQETGHEMIDELKQLFELANGCCECVAEIPKRPKGEYIILNFAMVEESIYRSRHEDCRRNWILAKEHSRARWYKVRQAQKSPGPSGVYAICEYAIDDSDLFAEKEACPLGDTCMFAHSEVECNVWSQMFRLKLQYSDLKAAFRGSRREKARTRKAPEQSENDNATASLRTLTIAGSIPADAVRPGSHYDEEPLLPDAWDKVRLEIIVSKADGPGRFYFQKRENVDSLDAQLLEMNAFYNSSAGDRYAIADEDLHRRLPIAFRTSSTDSTPVWRRAEIIDYAIGQFGVIEVNDIDFGGVYYTKLPEARLLRGEYLTLPKQALEASLAYVCPLNGDKWSKAAVEFTQAFLRKAPLVAEVIGIWESKLAVTVGDNSDPRHVVYLGKLLCKKHYASGFKFSKPQLFSKDLVDPKNEVFM